MKQQNKSLVMLSSSMFIFGTIGIIRRYIEIDSSLLAFLRGILAGVFILCFMLITHKKPDLKMSIKKIAVLIVSGLLIGFNWMFLFEAYNYTTVSAATLCYYMEPAFLVILAAIFLKEKLTGKKIISIVAAIIGMVLVSGVLQSGFGGSMAMKGIAYGLAAAICYSIVVTLNKILTDIEPWTKTCVQLLAASCAMIPYLLIKGSGTNNHFTMLSIILILILGILHTGITYTLYFASLEKLDAHKVAIFSYIDPITALILSAVILGEKMTFTGIVGAVLILGAALYSEMSK